MKPPKAQLEEFDRQGCLFFPSLFSSREVQVLNDEVPALYAVRRAGERARDRARRSGLAAHLCSAPFARHPRMEVPVKHLVGEDAYLHSSESTATGRWPHIHPVPAGRRLAEGVRGVASVDGAFF